MMKRVGRGVRLTPKVRKESILDAALRVAEDLGFQHLNGVRVAEAADVAVGLVFHYYSTMVKLRRAVMRAAVHQERLTIIRYGVAIGDKQALKAPADVLEKVRKL